MALIELCKGQVQLKVEQLTSSMPASDLVGSIFFCVLIVILFRLNKLNCF